MNAEWKARYPAAEDDQLRQDLDAHFAALLASPITAVPLDSSVIAAARVELAKEPEAARAYASLRASDAAARLPAWTVVGQAWRAGRPGVRAPVRRAALERHSRLLHP